MDEQTSSSNPMDRPVDPTFLRRRRLKRIAASAAGLAAAVWLFLWLPGLIRPSVDSDRIRTAKVQQGPVEETITASGTIVPEFEQVLFSPIDTRLLRILEKPGAVLEKGQPIVELDLNGARLEVERREEDLALKRNRRTQLELDERQKLSDLETRLRLKKLDLQRLQTRVGQYVELQEIGAVSQEALQQVQLEAQRTGIELHADRGGPPQPARVDPGPGGGSGGGDADPGAGGRGGPPPPGAGPRPGRPERRPHRGLTRRGRPHPPGRGDRPHRRPQLLPRRRHRLRPPRPPPGHGAAGAPAHRRGELRQRPRRPHPAHGGQQHHHPGSRAGGLGTRLAETQPAGRRLHRHRPQGPGPAPQARALHLAAERACTRSS